MRIAFVGKGGSGKTTLASLFSRWLVSQDKPVLAIDADINQHLRDTLGIDQEQEVHALGDELLHLKEYLRGTNSRISTAKAMLKTTPPGAGSHLLLLDEPNPIFDHFAATKGSLRLLMTGGFQEEDLGIRCYHSKTGAVELILNHLVDRKEDTVVIDMTAGADAFASGLFTRFDLTVIVVEPTKKSLDVYRQYKHYASTFDVALAVIGNKITSPDDEAFIRDAVGTDWLGKMPFSSFVRRQEQQGILPIEQLDPEAGQLFAELEERGRSIPKDWPRFYQQACDFHRRNAQSWGNATVGEDVSSQIDPAFQYPVR